jgi:N-acetylneuraminic acid mutarotase
MESDVARRARSRHRLSLPVLLLAAALGLASTVAPPVTPAHAQSGPTVTSLTLIDADRDQPVPGFDPLPNGATLNLATLPTRNLNIRANTSPATVGSVRFGYDGNASFRTETAAPYALAGDSNGNYAAWTPSLGSHTVTATPYTGAGGTGTAGPTLSVTFTVTESTSGGTGTAVRINAGGGAFTDSQGRAWAADKNFTGGRTFATTQPINGTVEDPLYQTERYGNVTYQIPVASGTYQVVLHFAEIWWTSAGQRVFDVTLEGILVLDNLDIWATVGGFTPLVRSFVATVADGALTIQLTTVVDNAKISAIEVLPQGTTANQAPVVNAGADRSITTTSTTLTGTASDDGLPNPPGALTYAWSMVSGPGTVSFSAPGALSTTATFSTTGSYTLRLAASDGALITTDDVVVTVGSTSGGTAIRINAGGGAFTDSQGRAWAADKNFTGGTTFSTTQPINGTAEDPLYQSERYGNFTYQIPVPNGSYEVVLHFAEIYFNATGQRVFDVSVEGSLAIDNLDIWSQVGALTPLALTVPATVSDGSLTVQFTSVVNNAKLSAIEVLEHPGHPFLHVVIQAPAWVVDYDGNGRETVSLKGSDSHTHQLGGTLTGFTWTEGSTTLGTTANIAPSLLVGPHTIALTITDGNSPPQSLSDSVSLDVFPINAVGGAMAAYYPAGSVPVTTLIDSLPETPGFQEVLPTLRVEANAGKVGGSPYTGNVVVVMKGTFTAATSGSYSFPMTGGVATRLLVDGTALSGSRTLAAGAHTLEARFAIGSTSNLPAEVRVSFNGGASAPLNKTNFTHDETSLAPFVNSISPASGPAGGGQTVTIGGLGFFPSGSVAVRWGSATLTPPAITVTPEAITLVTPAGSGTVAVSVQTPNGVSNAASYAYDSGQVAIGFTMSPLVTISGPTQAAWGPDGRLYVGTVGGTIVAYTFDGNYAITNVQTISALSGASNPNILGIAFNPFDPPSPVKIYVAHSQLFAHNGGSCFTGPSPYNGQISVLTGPSFSTATPLVTGLPVSNHDHGINGMAFDAVGDLLVAVGGNTNAGIVHCNMGGLPESPLSAAIVKVRLTDPGFNGAVQYRVTTTGAINNDQVSGQIVDVVPGVDVAVHVPGLRNPYDVVWHTRGRLYGTDNGPNSGFGAASTSATTQASDPTAPDEILALVEGHYYGHPNRNRGRHDPRQNVYRGPTSTTFLGEYTGPMATVASSSNGIDEYRATTFNGAMRGHLLVQKFNGVLYRAALAASDTSLQSLQEMPGVADGLDVVAGPGGVILGIDYQENRLTIARPNDTGGGAMKAFDIFPWRARTDGSTPFVIGGVNFAAGATVTIGGAAATVTSVTPTRIKGFVPAKTNPTAALLDVVVTSGGAASTIPQAVRYLLTPGAGTGQWVSGPAMPVALGEVAAGVIGGVLYIVGQGTSSTLAFDPVTHTWLSNLPPRPFPGHHHAAEVINGKLYLFGGLGSGSPGKVQIYNPDTDTWSTGADIPFATGSASTSLINGKVYLAGGIVGSSTVNHTAVYDPATNAWSMLAAMPAGRNHAAAATDGSKLYVFGGRGPGSGDGNVVALGFDDVQVYDPATNTWQTSASAASGIPPFPQKRGGMGKAVFLGGEFYVMGGETTSSGTGQVAGNVYNRVDVYHPLTKTWRLDAPMPTARHGIFPVLLDGKIHVPGGGTQAGFSSSAVHQILSR